jgi:hypothetical protein
MPLVSDEEAMVLAKRITWACRSRVEEITAMQNIANWYLHRGDKEIISVEQQEIVDGLLKKYREQEEGTTNPPPKPNDSIPIWDLVIKDMQARDNVGRKRYGTPLQANNGRDALQDAYEEALDLAVYLRQVIEERRINTSQIPDTRSPS